MDTTDSTAPLDPGEAAEKLAKGAYATATALRNRAIGLPLGDADQLNQQADAAEEQGDSFTAAAIAAVLAPIQANLTQIQEVTTQANAQLAKLQTVGQILTVSTLVLAVGTAAMSGDSAAIIKAVQALADNLSGTAAATTTASSASS